MPMHVITAPGFPHHTKRGYWRGCNCRGCREAMRRHKIFIDLRRTEGRTLGTDRVDSTPAREHLRDMLAADPTITYNAIARAAGISHRGVGDIVKGRYATMRRDHRQRVLDLTVDQARAHREFIPRAEVMPLVRQLQAAGYPLEWLTTHGVLTNTRFAQHRRSPGAASLGFRPHIANHIRDLHARYADTPATPEATGIAPHVIARCRDTARANGWWPVWLLDDGGELDPRAVPDHPWAQLDAEAARRLDVLRDVIGGLSLADIAAKHDVMQRRISRWIAAIGVRASDPTTWTDCAPLLADYYDGDADPVTTALRIGLLNISGNSPASYRTHPSVAAYLEAHPHTDQPVPDQAGRELRAAARAA